MWQNSFVKRSTPSSHPPIKTTRFIHKKPWVKFAQSSATATNSHLALNVFGPVQDTVQSSVEQGLSLVLRSLSLSTITDQVRRRSVKTTKARP